MWKDLAINRLMLNEKFSVDEMLRYCGAKVGAASATTNHVLIVQDTTDFCFETVGSRSRSDLGYLCLPTQFGFFAHLGLVVNADNGICLGISDIKFWSRESIGARRTQSHKTKLIEEKESSRWIETASRSQTVIPKEKMITVIADREGDIFEAWYRVPNDRVHFLTRARCNRKTPDEKLLFEKLEMSPLAGQYTLDLPPVKDKRTKRTAQMEVGFIKEKIVKPSNCLDNLVPEHIELFAVEAREISPVPFGEEPIIWKLLTTYQVEGFEDAIIIINWYRKRWLIEELFRITKKKE